MIRWNSVYNISLYLFFGERFVFGWWWGRRVGAKFRFGYVCLFLIGRGGKVRLYACDCRLFLGEGLRFFIFSRFIVVVFECERVLFLVGRRERGIIFSFLNRKFRWEEGVVFTWFFCRVAGIVFTIRWFFLGRLDLYSDFYLRDLVLGGWLVLVY